jgi:hypothetical protein
MPATTASQQAPAVGQPKYPLGKLTTYELRGYRRQLERAIRFYEKNHPDAPVLADLRSKLTEVTDEQKDRADIAAASGGA